MNGLRLVSLAATIVVCVLAAGCDSGAGVVTIKNDLAKQVTVRLCSNNQCTEFYPPKKDISAGRTWEVNVSKRGVPNVYLVLVTATGQRLGCLPLVMPKDTPGVVAHVSQRLPCSSDKIDESTLWPPS